MTPFGFVFLTLMFGIIVPTPTPTHGKVNITFREVMPTSSSALEKRQLRPENAGEYAALLALMKCLEKLGQGSDTPCNDDDLDEVERKYLSVDFVDIPLDAWERVAKLKCLHPLICLGVCSCRNTRPVVRPDDGNPDPMSEVPCPRIERNPRVKCTREYRAYHQFTPPRTPLTEGVSRNQGVSVEKFGRCITVMAAAVYAISRHWFPRDVFIRPCFPSKPLACDASI